MKCEYAFAWKLPIFCYILCPAQALFDFIFAGFLKKGIFHHPRQRSWWSEPKFWSPPHSATLICSQGLRCRLWTGRSKLHRQYFFKFTQFMLCTRTRLYLWCTLSFRTKQKKRTKDKNFIKAKFGMVNYNFRLYDTMALFSGCLQYFKACRYNQRWNLRTVTSSPLPSSPAAKSSRKRGFKNVFSTFIRQFTASFTSLGSRPTTDQMKISRFWYVRAFAWELRNMVRNSDTPMCIWFQVRMLPALAFLPPAEVPEAFKDLAALFPQEAMPLRCILRTRTSDVVDGTGCCQPCSRRACAPFIDRL